MDQLKLLMDYTKFHIGFYLTFAGIGVTLVKTNVTGLAWLAPSFAGLLLAGICGGVIASNIPLFSGFEAFKSERIGFWHFKWWRYSTWAFLEHLGFWFAVLWGVLVLLAGARHVSMAAAEPPNLVRNTDLVTTAGQPSAAWLAGARERGFDAVVYLAPPSVPDAVSDEAAIVGRQGLVFVNIPIRFARPTAEDLEAFVGVMDTLAGRRLLVHCQVNLRASSMLFLYRVIARKEDPHKAYADVSRVWTPDEVWKTFIAAQLKKAGVGFDVL
jgi:protein tyrosine phosphatase (PTP) superfamily phosphohydrolase (DUF442 family)